MIVVQSMRLFMMMMFIFHIVFAVYLQHFTAFYTDILKHM